MLIRIVRMTFQENQVQAFLKNFESNKKKIRSFPGCHHLELWQDENQKNIFLTYSHWENEEALNKYRDSELFKSVWTYTKSLFSERPIAFSSKKFEEVEI
ncbi:putative quinol monooxygenase [Algoriphagus limi]|uniref:Antibiotic biosynthesis monooxygenase n=1 Tax=Algoriphagus limi TaxID=2975273 RepID=A0ABT2G8L8_9BACT|nr:antibiotic biosynthesis monooxygenase family protein [Algoriphagus limi]MCS5491614.1 antibiotic biosynthesis monooxygenase [Algoriphagus limi]